MNAVVTPAATDRITWSDVTSAAISPSTVGDVLRLDGDDDERRTEHSFGVRRADGDAVALAQLVDPLGPADRDSELVRPTPARAQEAADERLAEPAGAEDRDPSRHRRSTNDAPWLRDGASRARGPSTRGRTSASRG